jgi:uncharacterized protein
LTVFADSSALVKLYADERNADVVRAVPIFVVSALARVEVPAALWRKNRMQELSAGDARVLTAAFEREWRADDGRFVAVSVRTPVLDAAAALVATHALRAYDAVQLACALEARGADPEVEHFLGFDTALTEAAAREGFHLAA